MLDSLKLRFDPVEDRLVLTVTGKQDATAPPTTLHLTRRLCAAWQGDLAEVLRLSAQPPARLEPKVQTLMAAANHQALAAQAVRRSEPVSTDEAARPAQLVTRVTTARERTTGRWVLRFELRNAPPLTLTLSDQTMHALIDAFGERVTGAHWQLPPLATKIPDDPPAATDHAKQLH